MTNPSNPNTRLMELFVGVGSNGGRLKKVNMIPDGFAIGDEQELWKKGVLDNLRITEVDLDLKEGTREI